MEKHLYLVFFVLDIYNGPRHIASSLCRSDSSPPKASDLERWSAKVQSEYNPGTVVFVNIMPLSEE